jgi:hypothetical protein
LIKNVKIFDRNKTGFDTATGIISEEYVMAGTMMAFSYFIPVVELYPPPASVTCFPSALLWAACYRLHK